MDHEPLTVAAATREYSPRVSGGQHAATAPSHRKHLAAWMLALSLALVLIGGLGAWLVQTDRGSVQVTPLRFPAQNGQWITADLFRPLAATRDHPAPMVVVCPGFERSKETMSGYAIELARRGIAVITIDPYNQGASSGTRERRSATVEGYGVVPVVEYIHGTPNLNYVDKSRIGAVGYSAGGNAVLQSASRFGARQAKALKQARAKDSDGGTAITDAERAWAETENKLAAIFVGGYVLTMTDAVLKTIDANVGMDYASSDEGAYRNEKRSARMQDAAESLRLVNSAFPSDQAVTEVEIGHVYGDPARRTMRVVHNSANIHPLLPYAPGHIAHMVDFFTLAFNLPPPPETTGQTWLFKELFTLVALAGALWFVVPFASLLLRLPLFESLVHPLPAPQPPLAGRRKVIFWSAFAFSAVLACALFIPAARATFVLFPTASDRQQTWWFPQRINNAILLWAIANGIIGLAIFFVVSWLARKEIGHSLGERGLKTSIRELLRTFSLALVVFAGFYALLFASYSVFHTDFRFTFVSAAASFPSKMLLVALEYLPLFFIFYLANSIRVNCGGRFVGQREWLSLLIAALGNSVGLMMILAIQYTCLAATGSVFWTDEWIYVNLLLGVTPMMFLLPYFHRAFFNLTGKVYLGPMITCLIFVMMMLTGNVCYIPLP